MKQGRYPVILSCGPYGKWLAFPDGYPTAWEIMVREHPDVAAGSNNQYQAWEVVDPEKSVPDGYVYVRVDSRDAGRSPGHIDYFSPRETKDIYDCIEWAAQQPWSDGKIGMNGISYYAINQWQVAGLQPCLYRKLKSAHNGGEARRGQPVTRPFLSAEPGRRQVHLCPMTGAS